MKRSVLVRLAALLMCVCLCVSMTACRKTETENVTYTIAVQSQGGMALADVRVNIYNHSEPTDLVWAGMTDEDGKVSFEAAPDALMDASVAELPAGFAAEMTYPLTGAETMIRLQAALQDGALADQSLSLGDMMCDFSVMAGDPAVTSSTLTVEYTLSELLKTKKAVVLNFWFEGCGPCRTEFPYLQKAYEAYADEIEVLAINPYDGTAQSVITYAANLGLTFPVVKGEDAWQSAMELTAYPTTVVIDRYGMIAMIHKGSVTQEGVFEAVFDHFTADDYVQHTVRNLSELE